MCCKTLSLSTNREKTPKKITCLFFGLSRIHSKMAHGSDPPRQAHLCKKQNATGKQRRNKESKFFQAGGASEATLRARYELLCCILLCQRKGSCSQEEPGLTLDCSPTYRVRHRACREGRRGKKRRRELLAVWHYVPPVFSHNNGPADISTAHCHVFF